MSSRDLLLRRIQDRSATVAIVGLESPALDIIRLLEADGAEVSCRLDG